MRGSEIAEYPPTGVPAERYERITRFQRVDLAVRICDMAFYEAHGHGKCARTDGRADCEGTPEVGVCVGHGGNYTRSELLAVVEVGFGESDDSAV